MTEILFPVLTVTVIGLIAGIMLALASKFLAVPVDEKVSAVRDALPGANCGACGYTGCDGYAAAVAAGEAAPNLCVPGGAKTASAVAAVLGVEAGEVKEKRAYVRCSGCADATGTKFDYSGIETCAAANMLIGGPAACAYGCLGFGDCASVCDFGAITVVNGVAEVDRSKCTGCGKCAEKCPKKLIEVSHGSVRVGCSSKDKGADVRKVCSAGCIGCMLCVKACEHGAVKVESSLAYIDPDKCVGCGKCAEKCPQKVIH